VARIGMDFLGPVPRTPVRAEVELLRPGRRIQLSEARLWAGDRQVAVARVWHLATAPGQHAGAAGAAGAASGNGTRSQPPDPQPQRYFGDDADWGYGRSIEWRTVTGGFSGATGAADVWTRVQIPLIAGRPLDGLTRFAVVADSANGLSAPLDFHEWLFIPPGVTMHLHRYPAGEWVRLTATSDPGRDGIGLTEGTLSDVAGRCGTVAQPLLVAPRLLREDL
jgi:hypothetical protein